LRVRGPHADRGSDRLRANLLAKQHVLEIELEHLIAFNEELANRLSDNPADALPLVRPFSPSARLTAQFEEAVRRSAKQILNPLRGADFALNAADFDNAADGAGAVPAEGVKDGPAIQITLRSKARLTQFRDLQATSISKLVRIPGIVISASVLASRAERLSLACKNCRHVSSITVNGGFAGFSLPRTCGAPAIEGEPKDCPLDPYMIVHEKCAFVDQQVIKLQESPDAVPVGELPRHIQLCADRYLTGKVVPGSRIIATGIYSTYSSGGRNVCSALLR